MSDEYKGGHVGGRDELTEFGERHSSNRALEIIALNLVELRKISAKLYSCVCAREQSVNRVVLNFAFGLPQQKQRKARMIEVSITNEQKVTVTLAPVTSTGKPAKLDGVPTWEVVSGNSTIVVAGDGLSAELISSDDPGDTEFLVKADANLGEGVEEISDIIRLSVLGANAANLGLVASAPVAK